MDNTMGSTSLPFRPFSFQSKDSTNLPSKLDMEPSIEPNASQSSPRFADNYESRDITSVPKRNPGPSKIWNGVSKTWETVVQETPGGYSPHRGVWNSNIQPAPAPAPSPSPSPRSPRSPRSPTFQAPPSPRSPASRQQASSPTPPMTKSSQKILQLTGFDPRFERALPIEHQQLSPTQPDRPQPPHSPIRSTSSNSTGSFYSQPEASFRYEQAGSPKNSSTSIAQSSNSEGEYLTSSIYNISEHSSKSSSIISRTNNMKTRMNNEQAVSSIPQPSTEDEPLPPPRYPTSSQKSRDSNEITTLSEILSQEQLQYEKKLDKDNGSASKQSIPRVPSPIPSPLTAHPNSPDTNAKERTKATPKHITVEKDNTLSNLSSAKDSQKWDIYNLGSPSSSSPSRSKYPPTPASPMFSMESDHLSLSPPLGSKPHPPNIPPRTRRLRFGSGAKHPLKSPFPFSSRGGGRGDIADADADEEADSVPSPSTSRTFKRRVSSTIKHLSPTSPSGQGRSDSHPPRSEEFVITNRARRADGPATPLPPKHGFLEGVMRGKEVLGKVGKSVVGGGMSREERRRENLKKRIVVVGITDQSPDGRVAEWL